MATIKRRTVGDFITDMIIIAILLLISFICIYPIWFVLIASVSDPTAIALGQVTLIPKGFTVEAYQAVWEEERIWIGYRNSLVYLFVGTFIMFGFTLPAAYTLSRKKLKGRRVINFLFTISMYISGGLVPTYLLHVDIGWVGTMWCLLIPQGLSVYNMILARSAFESMPEALYESASLDGLTDFGYFLRFAIPLSKATLAVLFLYTALSWWNMYMPFIIYNISPQEQSLQVILREITSKLTTTMTENMTANEIIEAEKEKELMKYSTVVVAAIPFCLLYPFIQKYFNKGVMVGAVKG